MLHLRSLVRIEWCYMRGYVWAVHLRVFRIQYSFIIPAKFINIWILTRERIRVGNIYNPRYTLMYKLYSIMHVKNISLAYFSVRLKFFNNIRKTKKNVKWEDWVLVSKINLINLTLILRIRPCVKVSNTKYSGSIFDKWLDLKFDIKIRELFKKISYNFLSYKKYRPKWFLTMTLGL